MTILETINKASQIAARITDGNQAKQIQMIWEQ